jgi:hypothetical protein
MYERLRADDFGDRAVWAPLLEVYRAMGEPSPTDSVGRTIPKLGDGRPCAHCGEPGWYRMSEAISDSFTTMKNASRAWPFGGDSVCAACIHACKSVALRCAGWFAKETGIWFFGLRPLRGLPWSRPDALSTLLSPPEPPFVAGLPMYGIDHGGESNLDRCWPGHADPLVRLQSKHVAIYARVATSRYRYPLQVDDQHDVVVDVALWSHLRSVAGDAMALLRGAGVGHQDTIQALYSLGCPSSAGPSVAAEWPRAVARLQQHCEAPWWRLFVSLMPMPKEGLSCPP